MGTNYDHEPAHVHATYGEQEALIEIETLAVYRGELPRRALALVHEWATLHRDELRHDWELARSARPLDLIAPLEQPTRGMKLVRISEVIPLEGFRLRRRLTDGSVIDRDVTDLLHGPVFDPIRRDSALFRQVRVEAGTVVWPNGADLCPDVLIWDGPPPIEASSYSAGRT